MRNSSASGCAGRLRQGPSFRRGRCCVDGSLNWACHSHDMGVPTLSQIKQRLGAVELGRCRIDHSSFSLSRSRAGKPRDASRRRKFAAFRIKLQEHPCPSIASTDCWRRARSPSSAQVRARPRSAATSIANIRAAGFPGTVHVVNPNYAEIEGMETVKSLDAITGPIDVAVITVPPAAVPETVAAAAPKVQRPRSSSPPASATAWARSPRRRTVPRAPPACGSSARTASACWCRRHSSMRASRRGCRRRGTSPSSRNPAPSWPA